LLNIAAGPGITVSYGAAGSPPEPTGTTLISSIPCFTSQVYVEAESTSAYATKGNVVTCLQAITIYRLYANVYGNSGDVYRAAILNMSSASAISGVAAYSNTYTFGSTVTGCIMFTFATPYVLTPGNIYCLAIEIISGTGVTSANIDATVGDSYICPGLTATIGYGRIASVAPTTGTLSSTPAPYSIFVIGSL
jgi:hypothetical protein